MLQPIAITLTCCGVLEVLTNLQYWLAIRERRTC